MTEQLSTNRVINDVHNLEIPSSYKLRAWDNTSEVDVTYFGYSEAGTVDSDENWVLKKLDEVNGRVLVANGSYDDRLTLTYS